jgi:hypothetical protein
MPAVESKLRAMVPVLVAGGPVSRDTIVEFEYLFAWDLQSSEGSGLAAKLMVFAYQLKQVQAEFERIMVLRALMPTYNSVREKLKAELLSATRGERMGHVLDEGELRHAATKELEQQVGIKLYDVNAFGSYVIGEIEGLLNQVWLVANNGRGPIQELAAAASAIGPVLQRSRPGRARMMRR